MKSSDATLSKSSKSPAANCPDLPPWRKKPPSHPMPMILVWPAILRCRSRITRCAKRLSALWRRICVCSGRNRNRSLEPRYEFCTVGTSFLSVDEQRGIHDIALPCSALKQNVIGWLPHTRMDPLAPKGCGVCALKKLDEFRCPQARQNSRDVA